MSPLKNNRSLLCLSLFLFLGFGIFTIITPTSNSSAEEIDVNVEVGSVISLSLSSNNLGINVAPTAAGATGSASTTATVSTNNTNGYTLTMSAKTDETALVHGSDSVSDKIATSGAASLENLAVNNWAYGLDGNDELFAVPGVSSPINIKTTDTPSNSSNNATLISVGAKVNSSIASGRYSNTLVFSAVGNTAAITWDNVEYMQDMTAEICSQAITPSKYMQTVPSKLLTDTRDGKTYTISKLADSKCWMTQNLALGGDSPITLTPEDSDIASNWTLKAGDKTWVASSSYPHFWVSDDSNYGNYYNWVAATANTGNGSMVSTSAPSSICPKGWRLPTGGPTGEFANLITNTYGIPSDSSGSLKVKDTPFSFIPAGYFGAGYGNYTDGFLQQGTLGYYWSSTAHTTTNYAYSVSFGSALNPLNKQSRIEGISIRCVAR